MNLVLIVSDTLRWDYLGFYGNDWIKTPNLDELASSSAIFTEAYAEGLPTLPARRAILTGRPVTPPRYIPQPSDSVSNYGWHPLWDQDVSAAEWLRQHGYYNGFVTDVYHMMKPGKNFHRGFDYWDWIRGQEGDMYALRDKQQVMELLEQTTLDPDKISDEHWALQHLMVRKQWENPADTLVAKVMTTAARWIENYTLSNPFFLYVDCFDPHEPWDPPAEYAQMYYPDYAGLAGVCPPLQTDMVSEEQMRCIAAAYAGEVTLMDRFVGRLLEMLDDKGLMDDTVIVFTADHGTMMGEQGQLHKGETRLRHQCTRVPLLIRHPGGELAGQQIDGFVQHHDILPTALGIMGLEAPERALGADIWPMAKGVGPQVRDDVLIGWTRYCSLRTKEWNLIIPSYEKNLGDQQPVRELYDLQADPDELNNVIEQHPAVARQLADVAQQRLHEQQELTGGTIQALDPDMVKQARITFDALPAER